MKKAMIYPYDKQTAPIIRHKKCLSYQYKITKFVSLKSMGLAGSKIVCGDGEGEENIVEEDFSNAIMKVDAVIIVDTNIDIDFEKVIYPKIVMALELGKEVIICRTLSKKEKALIESIKNPRMFCIKNTENFWIDTKELYRKIEKINIPIILVLGMGENTEKFEIQLSFRERLKEMGYKVGQIGSRQFCDMWGFHSFPNFMFDEAKSEKDKIIFFNHYLKKIEIEEKPDVLIIGIPGSIMAMNDIFTDDFGVLAFEVLQATQVDAAVFSLYYGEYTEEYLKRLKNLILYRFGVEVDYFSINDVMIDYNTTRELGKKSFITVDTKTIQATLENMQADERICNVMDEEAKEGMIQYVIEQLCSYSNVETI